MTMEETGEELATDQTGTEQVHSDFTEPEEDVIIAEAVAEGPVASAEPYAIVKAVIEAAIYITDEPLTAEQIATAVQQPLERVKQILGQLVTEYSAPIVACRFVNSRAATKCPRNRSIMKRSGGS